MDFAHILMYAVLGVKPVYIHDYGFKSRVYGFSHVFRDGPRGLRSLQRDMGRPYKCDSPGVVKSATPKCSKGQRDADSSISSGNNGL